MARIADKDHPNCPNCDAPMRPLYYLPLRSSIKLRAAGRWYCQRCDTLR